MTDRPVENDEQLWPNQMEVVDGVIPIDETPQDPNLFSDYDDTEMED